MKKKIEEIYYNYHRLLMSFIVKRVPDKFIAEDILQDVFMKVINKYDQLNNKKKVKNWLFQITRNSIIDYYRNEKQSEKTETEVVEVYETYENNANIKLQETVLLMIQQLSLKYRQSLYLADYKGMTHRDIAERLMISDACAKSRIQRARKLMKEIYLKCCRFEFDRTGKILDYYPR